MSQTEDVAPADEVADPALGQHDRAWLDEQLDRYAELLEYLHDH